MISYVEVMSKQKMSKFMDKEHEGDYIVISIRAHDSNKLDIPINTESRIKDVVYFMFDDVTEGYENVITSEIALSIRDFVNKHKDTEDRLNLIVHCDAGKSRSAGVAGAIMKYLYNDDTPIFGSRQYYPNMTCYTKVLHALFD